MKKYLLVGSIVCALLGGVVNTGHNVLYMEEASDKAIVDDLVEIQKDIEYLKLDEKAKKEAYTKLDNIKKSSHDSKTPLSFSQIKEVTSEEEYSQLLLNSKKEAFILYLGFDECPYCKAFTPKLNQLAKEMKLDIYYYNVRKRNQDPNFKTAMAFYKVDSVPHAFIVQDIKVKGMVNYDSTMEEIEQFLIKFTKLK